VLANKSLKYEYECTDIFSRGGGEALAQHAKVPFLGRIPLEPRIAAAADTGNNFVHDVHGGQSSGGDAASAKSVAAESFAAIANKLL
jgi:hypothetical protein